MAAVRKRPKSSKSEAAPCELDAGQPAIPATKSVLPQDPPKIKPYRRTGNQHTKVVPATVAEIQKRSVAFAASQIIPTQPLPDETLEWPKDCPRDHEGWKESVSYYLGIAIFKMAKRLALEGHMMPLRDMTLSMAVATDKRLLITGQPTSFNFSMSANLGHEDLIKRIKGETTRPLAKPGENISGQAAGLAEVVASQPP